MARVGISLGSNLGDRPAHLRAAVAALEPVRSSPHLLLSSVYETDPVDCPPGSGAFLNAVIEIETELSPLDLLARTQAIERELGRPSLHQRNAPRTVDLDLLYYDQVRLAEPALTLPHPRMWERAFVITPLAEIRPDLVPPGMDPAANRAGIRRWGKLG
ncbi:MAG: 2-amino-4-hydroxy-6-hydroxymethyldihydropteridine diphosphokinase [Verrucomicrobiaceae bacterium]|nr:2-amino-4-hydroxy-6-hydroxymethyldihydropteridine diphosphokinase [Verrucomicrobiaceae bacterium]